MIRLVALAAADGLQEGLLGRFDAARVRHVAGAVLGEVFFRRHRAALGIQRRELQQLVGAGRRVVDVLVGQGDVLQDRDEAVFTFQPLDQLEHRVHAGQGM